MQSATASSRMPYASGDLSASQLQGFASAGPLQGGPQPPRSVAAVTRLGTAHSGLSAAPDGRKVRRECGGRLWR